MIRKFFRLCGVFALGAAMLTGAAAVPAAAASAPRQVSSLPPQLNVPTLDAGGPAKTVTYPPSGEIFTGPGSLAIQAPPHTRITGLELNCSLQSCPVQIAADGRSATAQFTGSIRRFNQPYVVYVAADIDAPLAGGTFSGTITSDGSTQPLIVNIAPGIQGIIAANLRNTTPPGGGVRVISVDPGTSTAAAGLQPGDLITEVAGTPTPTVNDLDAVLSGKRSGATYSVTVMRAGVPVTLQIPLDPQ